MKLIPEGWRWPRIVTHLLDSDSKTATLGYMIFVVSSTGLFRGRVIDADTWLICVVMASTLIGGKLVGETILSAKLGKKEGKNDPTPPNPA